jgi:hypothetical protein
MPLPKDPQFAPIRVQLDREECFVLYELIKITSGGLDSLLSRAQRASGAEMVMWGAMLQFVDQLKVHLDARSEQIVARNEKLTFTLFAASVGVLSSLTHGAHADFESRPFRVFVAAANGNFGPVAVQGVLSRLAQKLSAAAGPDTMR